MGVRTDGALWGWGASSFGQIGDGTNLSRLSPVQIGTATDWKVVACAGDSTFALKTDNSLWAWGNNLNGVLGDGTTVSKNAPVQIGTATDWAAIYPSHYSGISGSPTFVLALRQLRRGVRVVMYAHAVFNAVEGRRNTNEQS